MTRPQGVSQWQQIVSSHLPHLSRPHCTVLALWSIGIVLAQSCGLSRVAVLLAVLLDQKESAVRERLRDWYRDAPHKSGSKRGHKRRSLSVRSCFPFLLLVITVYETGVKLTKDAMELIETQIERLPGLEKWCVDIRPSAFRDD